MTPWRFEGANTSEQQIWGRSGGVSSLFGGRCCGEFVGPTLTILGRIGWLSRIGGGGFTRLILGTAVTTLGQRASKAYQQYKNRAGEVAQNQILELRHPSTHKFPD